MFALTVLAIVVAAYGIGVVVYALLDNGKEKPEPIETDVEHDNAGNKLPKTSLRYWLAVLVEGLFSWPASRLRRALGRPQK